MKNPLAKTTLFFIALLILAGNVRSQSLSQLLSDIKAKITEVQVDKITFKQSLEILDETKGKLRFVSVEVNEKGAASTSAYEFYVSDLDKNTIIRKTEGKKLLVSIAISNKQKFVKCLKDDKLFAYVDNVEILVSDADAAQSIMDKVKAAIPLVKSSANNWTTAKEALLWLKTNIKEVTGKTSPCTQTFSFDEKKEYLVTFNAKSADSKGVTVDEKYEVNILDINKTQIQVKVTGTLLSVNIETKGGDKFVKFYKNNAVQNFTNGFEILAEDVDQARGIIAALTVAIEKSKQQTPEFKTWIQAVDFIKSNVGEVATDTRTVKQKIEFAEGVGGKTTFTIDDTDSKGKTIVHKYELYMSDIEPASLNFKVSGKKVDVILATLNKTKLIKYTKDNVLQNYDLDVSIGQSDVETARYLVAAFTELVKQSASKARQYTSVTEAMKFLEENVKGETVINEKYEVTFEGDYTESFLCELKVISTDAKGIVNEINYQMYPNTIDPASIHLESSGKYLSVVAGTKGKKSLVKKLKKDANSFNAEFEIMAFDSKLAREISDALKYIATNAIPKEKKWDTKQSAMAYVKENVGNLSGTGKEVLQKLEFANDDPCKITFTVNTTDSKGKTLEEIYEFNLSDMNKLMVNYKTSGGNVFISLVCKNKQKLVKIYKNGEQQAYGSDVEIIDDDIDTALNMVEALKAAVIKCEQ